MSTSRAAELESLVTQLRAELEQEKTKSKHLHYEKVAEVKSAREKEQDLARKQLEDQKRKFEREKENDHQTLRDSLSKDFKQQLRAVQKQQEEQVSSVESKWKKERSEMRSKIKLELHDQVEQELRSKFAGDQKKMTRELFGMSTQLRSAEEQIARLKATSKNKDDLLREKDEELHLKIEQMGRSDRRSNKKHMEELDGFRRQLQAKEKELSQMAEKLSRTMADKDKLEDDYKRLKQADSWGRRSATPTSPTISPSISVEELAVVSKQVSKRERDMVIRNSELSFRVRTLEEGMAELKKENEDLKTKITESRSQLVPLKEHTNKLNHRINDLNATLRSREKKMSSLSQEIVELKTAKQHLEEEYTRQRKSLQQQMTKGSSYRSEMQKLTDKTKTLNDTNARLLVKVDRLEKEKDELDQRLRNFTLTSPTPLSPPPFSIAEDDTCSLSSSSSSIQLLEQMSQMEFDKDETEVKLEETNEKYQEMKTEYLSLRDKYKSLRSTHESTQKKLRELQTSHKQELSRSELLEKESLQLEGELDLLRRATHNTSPYDQDREEVSIESLQRKVDEFQGEIDRLEEFITEQDTIWTAQEELWEEEKRALVSQLEQLQQESEDSLKQKDDKTLTEQSRMSELEEENAQLMEKLTETGEELASLQEENNQLSESLAARTVEESQVPELEEKNAHLAEKLNQTDAELALLRDENVQLSDSLAARAKVQSNDLDAANALLADKLRKTDVELTSQKEENSQLSEDLAARVSEVSSLQAANTRLTDDLSVAADKVTSLQERNAHLRKDAERAGDVAAINRQLSEDLNGLKNLLQEKEEDCAHLSERLAMLEEQLSIAREEQSYKTDTPIENEVENTAPPSSPPPHTASHTEQDGDSLVTNPSSVRHLAELSQQYKEQLEQKEKENLELHESLSLAQANIAQMKGLLENHQATLHDQSEDYQTLFTDKDQQISQLSDQLSQATSKLTRLRRAMPEGINHQMAAQLGHKVNTALRKLSTVVQSSPGSNSQIVSHLRSLESAVNELLHTLFPGTFDTGVNSEHSLTFEPGATDLHDDDVFSQSTPPHTPTPHTHTRLSEEEVVYYGTPAPIKPRQTSLGKEDLTSAWRATTKDLTHSLGPALPSDGGQPGLKVSNKTCDGPQESRVFVAVLDYEPKSLCITGKPDDELTFTTGAVLAVQGEMDSDGYYTATFDGKTGRVPANFIQEVDVSDPVMKGRLFNQTLGRPLTPDSYTVPSRHTLPTTPTESSLVQSFVSSHPNTPIGAKDWLKPPTHFKVDKALGNSVLLVTWQPPKMDTPDGSYSNGCLVTGYQLYVNGDTKTLISGAVQNKATLVGLNLSQPITLGISTSGAEGKSSKVITIHHQARPMSTLSSPSPEPEQYRVFIALYDYDPAKSSPCEHPEFELAFSEGDLIKIYGQEMDDGFMAGELNGQRGLVPASFVSEVKKPHIKQPDWRHSATESLRSRSTSPAAGPQLPATAKRMVASFDYNPERDSPNPNPEMELAFKRGDEISVFGKMHGDGYYSGQLGDKFGLVPSNYLTEIKTPLHHTHKAHDPTATPTKQQSSTKDRGQRSSELTKSEPQSTKQDSKPTKRHSSSVTVPTSSSPKADTRSPKPSSPKADTRSPKPSSPKASPPGGAKRKRSAFPWSKPKNSVSNNS